MPTIDLKETHDLIVNGLRIDVSHVNNIYDILISGSEAIIKLKVD